MRPVVLDPRAVLFHGTAGALAQVLTENSIDAIVTDPPAGIAFMGKTWDGDKGGRNAWIEWLAAELTPAYRALKPGGHGLCWALPRTSHWTAFALEGAGFEIRDRISHFFGQGFPKSMNLALALDDHFDVPHVVVGDNPNHRPVSGTEYEGVYAGANTGGPKIQRAGSEAGAAWKGWGTALKPACEDWWLFRKPLEGTYAENLLRYGVGGLNIDACRIGTEGGTKRGGQAAYPRTADGKEDRTHWARTGHEVVETGEGRWPAHVVLSHSPWCGCGEDPDECAVDCPVMLLDAQSPDLKKRGNKGPSTARSTDTVAMGKMTPRSSGVEYNRGDDGGASRFFYVAKPPRKEKEAGLAHLAPKSAGEATGREDGQKGLGNPRAGAGRTGGARNFHPTVKSVGLMRWLVRLITPPGGIVLDPFTGSATTAVAALAEGCNFIGTEQGGENDEYIPIAEGRIRWALTEYPAPPARLPGT